VEVKKNLGQEIIVQPVLVFVNRGNKICFGFKKIKGVYVVGIDWLNKLITGEIK
jgi:hypothetical protein